MSTSKTYQQSLADVGSDTRPPMLERGSYIPWASRFQRYINRDALLHYDAEIELMNLILLSIPNDIYNSLDACTSAKDMWKRFVTEPGEALDSVYNRFAQLMNNLERNDMHFPIVTINTKFLNSLQPEWLKYQFKKLVNTSRAKNLEKSHDPLALVAHMGSSSRNTSSYYVTHPTYVVDYDDEYQQDDIKTNSKDPLTSAMLLLARSITQNFFNPTNNRLRASSNTRNQAVIQGDRVNIQSRNSGNVGRNNRRAYVQEEVVEGANETGNDSKYFMKQMLLAKQDEAGVILTDKQNDFLFADASRMEEIKDLSANICLMAKIQPTNQSSDVGPSYDFAFISEVQSSSTNENEERMTLFQGDIKEMKDVFESTESELYDLKKQNDFLKDQLLEASLKHQVEISVLLEHECVDNSLHAEIKQIKRKSIEIQEGLQLILNLQHEKEKYKWDSTLHIVKNKQTDNTFANVISNKENVIDVDVANASKEKNLLCVSCMHNVHISCHDKYLVHHRLNASRTLTTKYRTPKSLDTTYVVLKTRFSKKSAQSKTLDTTYVVSKSKIDVGSASKAKNKIVQIVFQIVDSGCSKHMTGDRSLLRNFIKKFMGTVRFGNDNFAAIIGYGDYIQGNITIFHVYYVEGLGHNLFSVRQFCDGDLEVAFRSKTCYVRNLEGDDLLTGGRESNLYNISIFVMTASSPVCLMSKAASTMSWLWHHRLSHLNFGTINDLTILDLVDGLPKFKYEKDHLCSACEMGKSKKASHPPKLVSSDNSKLELLHMDLCGPMRVALINGKKYILVIVDDYSCYTWVYFLHSKDETPKIIKKFIAQAQLNYKANVCKIRTDNGIEFKNANLKSHYEKLGIMQQFSTARTPQQNGVVERRNHTLVETARTLLIFSRLPEFLWSEAVVTTCFTQNRSIIHTRYNKTPYELLHDRKPNVEYFHVFSSLCYPINDREDIGKMKPKADIEFVSYNTTSYEAIESSSTTLEPSNVQNFHQVQPSTHSWTKDHPLDQVIGDPSKPVMTRQRLHTDSEVCMYALTVSTIEPKNIKEAMAYHSWIESMQDELNQFERLQVWELVPRPEGKNIIALKWL
uniref:Retrovirus-related Pol polyprotein from transposon TNT 1-94 n=1 Tax=Tanacetum cinerariifolium TaxID=118510 RepID=A0A699H1L7_TANCI|nr:retrovirus-related Pol polyprotein from transposon TNT 1-94 [Tanacetum cinerariifolium]